MPGGVKQKPPPVICWKAGAPYSLFFLQIGFSLERFAPALPPPLFYSAAVWAVTFCPIVCVAIRAAHFFKVVVDSTSCSTTTKYFFVHLPIFRENTGIALFHTYEGQLGQLSKLENHSSFEYRTVNTKQSSIDYFNEVYNLSISYTGKTHTYHGFNIKYLHLSRYV